jgi:hypothetical protein
MGVAARLMMGVGYRRASPRSYSNHDAQQGQVSGGTHVASFRSILIGYRASECAMHQVPR